MKTVKYLNQDFIPFPPEKENKHPWDALTIPGLSKSKKIDLFYRLQSNHEAAEGNKGITDTIERRLIAKLFTRKSQDIWMNCMLRIRDHRVWGTKPSEVDFRILDELFRNYGAMIKAGTI